MEGISVGSGNHTGCDDQFVSILAQSIIKERLGCCTQLSISLGDQNKGTLDHIGAIQDGLVAGSNTANSQSLNTILDGCNRCIADSTGILRNCGDDVAGRGQFLAVLASILGTGDGLKAIAGTGTRLTADQNDFSISAADFGPVGDLTGVDLCDGFHIQIRNRVLQVDDDSNAIISQNSFSQAGLSFSSLQIT